MSGPSFFDFHAKHSRRAKTPPANSPPPSGDATALSVSQLTQQIDRAFKTHLPASVLVRGEVSNCKIHGSSGHSYFTLKDESACIDCVMFKSDAARLRFTPEDGLELLATGRVGVYAARGRYQLYCTRLEPVGQGALELAFQQVRAKLQAEGLFDPERKKPIPQYPRRLALVTSTQTAALQDMLKVLRRFPFLYLMVCHAPVQGEGAAPLLADAIRDINRQASALGGVDLILLARGGGSLEDLWAFNEEVLARAIVASRIPIISGIGHETDVSIADLVADHHAHTPTEAAQVATAHWRVAPDSLDALAIRLRREVRTRLADAKQFLTSIQRHELFRRPLDHVNQRRQLVDDRQRLLDLAILRQVRRWQTNAQALSLRLEQCGPTNVLSRLRSRLAGHSEQLARTMSQRLRRAQLPILSLESALREAHPRHLIALHRSHLDGLLSRLKSAAAAVVHTRQAAIDAASRHLMAVGPEQVLRRGYSITMLKKGNTVLRRPEQVQPGDRLVTRLADGTIESVVQDKRQLSLFE
jgi:exodeoxyribonuclease VII large subunit